MFHTAATLMSKLIIIPNPNKIILVFTLKIPFIFFCRLFYNYLMWNQATKALRNASGNLLSFIKGQQRLVLTEVRLQCKSCYHTGSHAAVSDSAHCLQSFNHWFDWLWLWEFWKWFRSRKSLPLFIDLPNQCPVTPQTWSKQICKIERNPRHIDITFGIFTGS